MSKKQRLDALLHDRGLVESREQGRRLIIAGEVSVNGRTMTKPGSALTGDEEIQLASRPPFVSRAGLKLQAALDRFGIDVTGQVVADIGASTGGFTDCLLQRGAARVYAVDVGYGQLAWKLRQDPRVVVMERVNARNLEHLPEPVDLATFDVSFISLELVVPPMLRLLKTEATLVILVKPQFEAGRSQIGKGGVIKDPEVHRAVLLRILGWARTQGIAVLGLVSSPIKGPAGNREFLAHLAHGQPDPGLELEPMVEHALLESPADRSSATEDARGAKP
jgi:23S rRNA (cytidine1920-2'-O)/16S rRNA (cytidine1409-2'-O)-methyltransferase